MEKPFPLLAHPYRSPTRGSVAYEMGNTASRNAIIFIGGLKDGPHTTGYIRHVARELEKLPELGYSVFEIRMRSSFDGFGTASLADDVHDIAALVKYLRAINREKIILFGHSTGCQVFPSTCKIHFELNTLTGSRTAWSMPITQDTPILQWMASSSRLPSRIERAQR